MIATATGTKQNKKVSQPKCFRHFPKSFKVGLKSSLKIVVQKTTIMGLQSKLRNGLSYIFDEEIST
jgi:hypothetical protein